MRILSLTHTFPLIADSGSPLRIWNVNRRLAERHELRLLASGWPTKSSSAVELPEWLESLPPEGAAAAAPGLWSRLRRQLRSLSHGIPPSVQAHRSRALQDRVGELVDAGWPDVVIAEEGSAAIELTLVPPSIPRVLVKHSVHAREIEERTERTRGRPGLWLERLAVHRYEKRGLRIANAVVTVCDEDRQELAERYGLLDATVVPNGCPEPESPWTDPNRPRVGLLADFRWRPNRWELNWFLEHVRPRLLRLVPEVEIDVIGHSPDPPWQAPEIPGVRWLGRVDDLFAALRSCRVLALPVRYGSGIRTRLLDGLALGMPIVTTPLGIRGVKIEPGVEADVASTAETFAASVGHLLTDAEARDQRHQAALALAQKMTWQASLERLEVLLDRLASR